MPDGQEDTSGLQPNRRQSQAEEQPRRRPRGKGSVAAQHCPRAEREARPLQCPHSVKSFTARPRLTEHLRTRSGDRSFKGPDCGKTFGKHSVFVVHRHNHTGECPFPGPACEKHFSHRSHLTVHQRIHGGERPYSCAECHESFISQSQLIVHQRTHTGEHPYRCLKCGKGFHQPTNLATHQRTHLAERALPCSQPARALLSPRGEHLGGKQPTRSEAAGAGSFSARPTFLWKLGDIQPSAVPSPAPRAWHGTVEHQGSLGTATL